MPFPQQARTFLSNSRNLPVKTVSGGPKYSYISSTWEPGSEITSVTDQKPPESQSVPEPSSVLGLLVLGTCGAAGSLRKGKLQRKVEIYGDR